MQCPRCDESTSRVAHTYSNRHPNIIYRRRRCLNEDCRATWRTWERVDSRDPCLGRRPGEPRRALGRPRKRLCDPVGEPPVVELPFHVQDEPAQASESPVSDAGPNWSGASQDHESGPTPQEYEDWRRRFVEAAKQSWVGLVGPGDR